MSKCGPDGKITLASVYMTIFAPGSHPNVHLPPYALPSCPELDYFLLLLLPPCQLCQCVVNVILLIFKVNHGEVVFCVDM